MTSTITPIYVHANERPMNIAFFSSMGPGNFQTALETAENYPALMSIGLLVTDNTDNPSIDLARSKGVPVIAKNFASELGNLSPLNDKIAYQAVKERLHDEIMAEMDSFQHDVDLIVLAYRRIITGRLLERFNDRIINQHPADLSVLTTTGKRKYVGIAGLSKSIRDGSESTRTSTILINSEMDGGDILCQGPEVPVCRLHPAKTNASAHETLQKRISDPPSLSFTLFNIANGRLKASKRMHDGSSNRVIYLDSQPLPYCGHQL